ncbi:MAG: hypothetical protein KDA86_13380 [Planctomycetaceae bacterium]|nr:hypothetical protein [Planctomycetaceae bacterium]
MHFNMLGLAERRFYHKELRKGEERVQRALEAADILIDRLYAAEFDNSAQHPILVHQFNNKIDVQIIRFASALWEPGRSDAANQIASILCMQFPRLELVPIFALAGLTIGNAGRKTDRLPDDDLDDATLVITTDLSNEAFFALVDQVEKLLADSGLGEVSGTGGGLTAWSLDLTSQNIEDCVLLVSDELSKRKFEFTVI